MVTCDTLVTMTTAVTLEKQPDGTSTLLTIEGTRTGPHYALVRAQPSAAILNHLKWEGNNLPPLIIPFALDEVTVQIDQDKDYPPDATYKGEEFKVKATKPKRRKEKVLVPSEAFERSNIDRGDTVLLGDPQPPDPRLPQPDLEGDDLEQSLLAQHRAAEFPHTAEGRTLRAPKLLPPEGTRVDPKTDEQKQEQHERAEFPSESDEVKEIRRETAESLEVTQRRADRAEKRAKDGPEKKKG